MLEFLCSGQKIERDRGVVELQNLLASGNDEVVRQLEVSIQNLLEDPMLPWESKHGALMGAKALLVDKSCSDDFAQISRLHCMKLLEHSESRVRLSAGK